MDKRLFVFMKHEADTGSSFAEKAINRVQIKKYTAENI